MSLDSQTRKVSVSEEDGAWISFPNALIFVLSVPAFSIIKEARCCDIGSMVPQSG